MTDDPHRDDVTGSEEEDASHSLVEIWDRSGQFASPTQSLERFREFLDVACEKADEGALDVAGIVALGEAFAQAGRVDETLAASYCLQTLFERSAADRELIAGGLVSIVTTLLDAGLRRGAAEAVAATESLVHAAEGQALRASLADAMFNRGLALKDEASASGNASLMEEAVAVYVTLEDAFGGSRGEPFEELVARGVYNKAGALGVLGRVEEAATCFSELADRHRESPDPTLAEVAMFAAGRHRMMLSVPDAPPYITEHPLDEALLTEPGHPSRPGAADDLRARREARLDAALKSHRQATIVLSQFRVKGLPFALFLRTFEPEAFSGITGSAWSTETGLESHVISFSSTQPSRLEQQIVEALAGRGSILGVANRDSLFESAWLIPRLFLPDEGWKEIVEALVRTAEIIIVSVEEMTPGVRWEVECVEACDRNASTLVVLAGAEGDEDDDQMRGIRRGLRRFGAMEREVVPATKEAAELAGFDRVIYEGEIPAAGPGEAPQLADLLHEMETAAKLDPEARVRRLAGL